MPFHPGLLLTSTSEVKIAKITSQGPSLTLADIQKYLKKKTIPQLLGTYPMKGHALFLFGYKDGKAGTENKHELPPPLDTELYFGDILLINSKDANSFDKPIPFKIADYETFYTQMFEGFTSLDDEDDDEELSEDEVSEDEEFEEEEEEEAAGVEEESDVKFTEDVEEPVVVNAVITTKEKKVVNKKVAKVKTTFLHTVNEFALKQEPELEKDTSEPGNEVKLEGRRLALFEIIHSSFKNELTLKEKLLLEKHIFNATFVIAEKKHILCSWNKDLFCEIYKSLARSVLANFITTNYTKNESLFKRYKAGIIQLEEIPYLSFSDLYPEIWKDLSMRQFEREKRQLEGNKAMATDQFHCKGCGKRECTYYELQTRSADEPMTIFIQCINCGKHWRL